MEIREKIAYRINDSMLSVGTLLHKKYSKCNGIYAFKLKKTARWYRDKFLKGNGYLFKIEGRKIIKRKRTHKNEIIFESAKILKVYEG